MSSPAAPATSLSRPPSEPRLCWICQQDETEDESPDTVWKAPCPCSLTAHNECLLEWITAQENSRQGLRQYNKPILCPQCQAQLKIERPHDYLVQLYNAIQRWTRSLVYPAALSGVLGCVYSGCLVYGFNTMEVVFGQVEARRLLGSAVHHESLGAQWFTLIQRTFKWSLTAFDPFFPTVQTNSNWKIFVGLPLIGPALVFSRMKLADQAFPLLLPLYFLNHTHSNGDFLHPPLTPGLAFATLPYISAAYNKLYREVVTPHEKRWDAAVQRRPREGETAAEIAVQAEDDEDEGGVLEIQIVEEIDEDEAMDVGGEIVNDRVGALENPERATDEPPIPDNNQPAPLPVDGQQQGGQQQGGQQQGGQAQIPNENDNQPWQMRQDYPLRDLLSIAIGPLFFPTVASYAGELLYLALPFHLVNKNVGLRSTSWTGGFLREKWGRTIVGGCLFVLLKDAVTIYVKWKRARDFGKRKILDYTGVRRGGA